MADESRLIGESGGYCTLPSQLGFLDLVLHGAAGGHQQFDVVRLASDPRIQECDAPGVVGEQRATARTEVDIGIVDDRLSDSRALSGAVQEDERDLSGSEDRSIHHHLIRTGGAVRGARDDDHDEGDDDADWNSQQPETSKEAVEDPQATTSKKPIQPSEANSLLWAWNMYLPVYGKRSSSTSRCPCPWMTVSVYS